LQLAGLSPLAALQADGPRAPLARKTLEAALSLPREGGYDSAWGSSGVPIDIAHAGEKVLSRSTKGTYCCGFTFAAAMQTLHGASLLDGRSVAQVRSFQKTWYGATRESAERQCADAVRELAVGREVTHAEALAGDFAQLWRVGAKQSGHSVLFLGWITLGEERVGLHYLSSQGSTRGIGFTAELFADSGLPGGKVDRNRLYFARLGPA